MQGEQDELLKEMRTKNKEKADELIIFYQPSENSEIS
jgi:hypothetical protein